MAFPDAAAPAEEATAECDGGTAGGVVAAAAVVAVAPAVAAAGVKFSWILKSQ